MRGTSGACCRGRDGADRRLEVADQRLVAGRGAGEAQHLAVVPDDSDPGGVEARPHRPAEAREVGHQGARVVERVGGRERRRVARPLPGAVQRACRPR